MAEWRGLEDGLWPLQSLAHSLHLRIYPFRSSRGTNLTVCMRDPGHAPAWSLCHQALTCAPNSRRMHSTDQILAPTGTSRESIW